VIWFPTHCQDQDYSQKFGICVHIDDASC